MDDRIAPAALPPLTQSVEQALQDVADFGVGRIEGVLQGAALARVHDALYRAAASDRERGWNDRFVNDNPDDRTNQRVWGLLSRDPVFSDLAEHPFALQAVKALLGWPVLLSNISANITGPGGGEMVLHADQGFAPLPWGGIQGVNIAWAIDDFTDENGATRIVPGSHRLNRTPQPGEGGETVALEAPAGSMIIMEGRVWHRTGFNRTQDRHRGAIFAFYTLPIYLPQENWFLSLNPAVRHYASETMLQLLGFKAGRFGRFYGTSLY
ncbi:MAG: phytanoyl-CoA dioxygenase family protein [Proteobacteria bacterium]|nr:phytanoyl-CoA dioxygenase family protein [Pseudomonadota bacterium]